MGGGRGLTSDWKDSRKRGSGWYFSWIVTVTLKVVNGFGKKIEEDCSEKLMRILYIQEPFSSGLKP